MVLLDNLSRGNASRVDGFDLVVGDTADRELLSQICRTFRISSAIHIAGYKSVQESLRHPDRYWENNYIKSERLVGVLVENGVEAMIFSSSCSVYGEHGVRNLVESDECRPMSPYAQSKLSVEKLLSEQSDLSSVCLRYFNAAGADLACGIGEDRQTANNLLPFLIRAIFQGVEVQIFGGDLPTLDGTGIRDYVHVRDVAEAHVAALLAIESGSLLSGTETLNIGTGVGHSVIQVINLIEQYTGRALKYSLVGSRNGDASYAVASPGRARNLIGWQCKFDMRAIVQTAVDWYGEG